MMTTPRTPSTPAARGKRAAHRKPLFLSPVSALKVDPSTVKDPGSYFGKLLVMLVLQEGIDDLVTFIDVKGADPNFVDPDDFTPLYVAVKTKQNETAKVLVQHGALITKKTKGYPSPLQLAIQTGNTDLVEFFVGRLYTAETDWVSAKREAAGSSDQPSRKRRRVEADAAENGSTEADELKAKK